MANLIAVKFNKKELSTAQKKLKFLIASSRPQVSRDVSKKLFRDINASGNVPFDTGNLKSDTSVFPDKFLPTYYTMGWFAPYARIQYYGLTRVSTFTDRRGVDRSFTANRVWKTIGGKRISFAISGTGNGMPFWDRPFTTDVSYMLNLYKVAIRKSKLGKVMER